MGRFEFFVTKNFLQILPELADVVQNLLKRVIFGSPIRLQFTPCIYITLVWLSRNKQRMFLPCRIIIGDGNLFVGGRGAHFNGLYMCVGKWLCVYFNRRFRITCRQDVSFYILRRTTCYISTFSCLQKRESFLAKHGFGNLQNCLLLFSFFRSCAE